MRTREAVQEIGELLDEVDPQAVGTMVKVSTRALWPLVEAAREAERRKRAARRSRTPCQ